MHNSYISFYLKASRIHIFVDTLRGLGSPFRICFKIDENGEKLLIMPYDRRDFKSHRVSPDVYHGDGRMQVYSIKLCRIIADLHNWDLSSSYRVPGIVFTDKGVAVFCLKEANMIRQV